MAVDRKADHVGNHGGRYTDMDGQTKQFTYIDHDVKTKIGVTAKMPEEELDKLKADLERFKREAIAEILAMPAVSAAYFEDYEPFIIRDLEKGIIWNEPVVTNACMINNDLRRELHLLTWRRTVKEMYWFDPIRDDHEAMLRGDWKKLM